MNKTSKTLNDNIIGFFESDELEEVEKEFNDGADEEDSVSTKEKPNKKYLNSDSQVSSSTPNYKTANPVLKKIKTRRINWQSDEQPQKLDLSNPYDSSTNFNQNDEDAKYN